MHPHLWILGAVLLVGAGLFVTALVQSLPFRVWVGGALATFIDGFIDGAPIGTPAGGGMAAADGQVYADLHGRHLLIELAHLLAIPFFTGLADVRSWKKDHAFPNIFSPSHENPPPPAPVPPQ